jgi:hypothetical protein
MISAFFFLLAGSFLETFTVTGIWDPMADFVWLVENCV